MDILGQGGGSNTERVMCTMLQMSPLTVNKMLHENGLEGWMIRKDEEPTPAKIAILNQLANGCPKFSTELRRRCSLVQMHLENFASQQPSLTEMIRVALGQFNNELFVRAIGTAAGTTDKLACVINFVARKLLHCILTWGPKLTTSRA